MIGPDYFGFYTNEISKFLSQDEDYLPFLPCDTEGKVSLIKNGCSPKEKRNICDDSLFTNALGAQFSDFKKERLTSLVRQSVFVFSQEVDEILDPIHQICRVKSLLTHKMNKLKLPGGTPESDHGSPPKKKPKIDPDLLVLLDRDCTKVEEMTKKHSDELFTSVVHMEEKLEECLGILMSKFRSMTLIEKQRLRKMIQELPPRNMGGVVEIIQRNKPIDRYPVDQIHVDLDKENNVTLWRLYFYVRLLNVLGSSERHDNNGV